MLPTFNKIWKIYFLIKTQKRTPKAPLGKSVGIFYHATSFDTVFEKYMLFVKYSLKERNAKQVQIKYLLLIKHELPFSILINTLSIKLNVLI